MLKRLLAIFLIFQLSLAPAAAYGSSPSPPDTPPKATAGGKEGCLEDLKEELLSDAETLAEENLRNMQRACQEDFEVCREHLNRAKATLATLTTLYGSDPRILGLHTDEERELFGELYRFQADKLVTAHDYYEQGVQNFPDRAQYYEAFKLTYDENILNMINSVGILSQDHPLRGVLGPKPQKTGAPNRTATQADVADHFQQNRKFWTQDPIQYNGNKVYQRNDLIDPNKVSTWKENGVKVTGTNMERMATGRAPIGPDGKPVNLHHMTQKQDGPIAELTQTLHSNNHGTLHMPNTVPSGINRRINGA